MSVKTDYEKLNLVADLFDVTFPNDPNPEIQTDLRRIANRIHELEALDLANTQAITNMCEGDHEVDAYWAAQIVKSAGTGDVAEIIALIEAAKRRPMTADKVRVTLPCDLWHTYSDDGFAGPNSMFIVGFHDGYWYTTTGRTTFPMYSNREAAEAARKANG